MRRRQFMGRLASLGVAAAIARNFNLAQANTFKIATDVDPTELSIAALQDLFANGFQSEAIVAGYLARIEREDALFKSVIAVNADNRRVARSRSLASNPRCRSRGTITCCGCRDPRQDEPQRMGELPLYAVDEWLECGRRANG